MIVLIDFIVVLETGQFHVVLWHFTYRKLNLHACISGLEIKKILRSPFGDQLEKYSHQMQIFSCQFV